MNVIRRQPSPPSRRQGAATVEFAIVAPIVLAVFVGAIEFARANQIANAAAFSAYTGCRQGIIPGGSATAATSAAQTILDANFIGRSSITVTPSTITDTTTTITVGVAVSMDSVGWITPMFTKSKTILRSCTLTREKTAGN
ncbi:TadE family protein [Schlesneria paludicola]|uniref:TadE family protein n=1 Tax=Schlesneria paludicola TaxID=360056 RepID=UPI000299CF85|nr:TadE family protein [Schlesneria paludicola]